MKEDRASGPHEVPLYLIYLDRPKTPWRIITQNNTVLFSGVNIDSDLILEFGLGFVAGVNTETALRRKIYSIDLETFDKESAPRHLVEVYESLE